MQFFITYCNFLLPAGVIILKFLLKLFIHRDVKIPSFLRAVFELPVDISFLSLSFLIGYLLTKGQVSNTSFTLLIFTLCFVISNIILWRLTITLFENNKKYVLLIPMAFNYTISIITLVLSVNSLLK
jgi:hypothetical protein